MLFHKHNFQESERFYAEPYDRHLSVNSKRELKLYTKNKNLFSKLALGETTILYKCVSRELKCADGSICKEEYLGNGAEGCGKTYQETILGKSLK